MNSASRGVGRRQMGVFSPLWSGHANLQHLLGAWLWLANFERRMHSTLFVQCIEGMILWSVLEQSARTTNIGLSF